MSRLGPALSAVLTAVRNIDMSVGDEGAEEEHDKIVSLWLEVFATVQGRAATGAVVKSLSPLVAAAVVMAEHMMGTEYAELILGNAQHYITGDGKLKKTNRELN